MLDDIEPAAERRIGERESEDLAELHIILRGALGDEADAEPLAHHLLDALGRADLDRRAQCGDVDAVLAQKLLARLIGAAALFAADERLLPNLPDGEGTARIGTVFFRVGCDEYHRVARKVLIHALVACDHRAAEADLHAARGHELDDLGTVLHLDVEGDVRVTLAEILQKVRQIILARHRGGRDGNSALHLLRKVAQRDSRVFTHLQNFLCVFVKELAGIGGIGLLRRADDELDIQFSLQRGDVRADGRLRQVEQLRGAGKAAIFHH